MSALKVIRESSGLYPITAYWVVASIVVALAVGSLIGLGSAIAILGIAAALVILIAAWAELKQIHKMVDGQRTETLAYMQKLEKIILTHDDMTLPTEPLKVREAKVEGGGE
jgi:hypothetical protein